jgi:3-hydroxyisobutyrate dehydrogenase
MGAPMALNLVKSGFDVTVHNRTRSREEPLAAEGAQRADTPADASRGADVVVTIVSDTPDVEEVLFGPHGVASTARVGAVVCDMSTISAQATRTFGTRLAEQDIHMLDAPVSGGSEGAQQGTLAVMVGGDAADVERALPVLECVGGKVTHVGPLGAGQLTKAVNQILVAGYFMACAEAMTFGLKAGLDMEKVIEAIATGAARSWVLDNRAPNMLANNYPLGFKLALHLKDLGIVEDTARAIGADVPLASMVRDIEAVLVAEHGDEDMSAIAIELRRRAGM